MSKSIVIVAGTKKMRFAKEGISKIIKIYFKGVGQFVSNHGSDLQKNFSLKPTFVRIRWMNGTLSYTAVT